MIPLLQGLLLALPGAGPVDIDDQLYSAVLVPGDLDRDGLADVVAAERSPAREFGGRGSGGNRVYALSGVDGALLWSRAGAGGFGGALADAGDLDGDGAHEIAVAQADASGAAPVLVLSGATGKIVLRAQVPAGVQGMGRSLAGGLDGTGDGIPDLLVGARHQAVIVDGSTGLAVGSVALVDEEIRHPGGRTHVVRRPRIRATVRGDGPPAARPYADAFSFSCSVAWLPDEDGDGRAEVAVGSSGWDDLVHGWTHVLFSADPEHRLTLPSTGWCLEVLDDVDGDGSRELAASTPSVDVCVYGLDDGRPVWRVSYPDGYMNGEGSSLDALPDLDGDGAPELLLGANETGFDCDPGFAAIYSGRTGAGLRPLLAPAPLDERLEPQPWVGCTAGLDAAAMPDLDGDGAPEVALHVARLGEVRVVSTRDWSVRWRVALADLGGD